MMGKFNIFKKKNGKEPPLKKKLSAMKCKTVNFSPVDFAELCAGMERSETELLTLKPVNYYAVKNEYIEAAFYSDDEHEENYVIFRLIRSDRPVSMSGTYPVSKDTLRKVYSKLGAVSF